MDGEEGGEGRWIGRREVRGDGRGWGGGEMDREEVRELGGWGGGEVEFNHRQYMMRSGVN